MADETTLRTYFIGQVKKFGRFTAFDVMVPEPDDEEIYMAVFEALDDINSMAPQTHFTLDAVYENTDPRWKRLVVLGAAAYSLDFMIFELTANGVDVQIGEIQDASKLADISSLRGQVFEQFQQLLEKLKTSSQKFCRSFTYDTVQKFSSTSNRRYINYTYSRMGRG